MSGTSIPCGLYELRVPIIQCLSLAVPWITLGALLDFHPPYVSCHCSHLAWDQFLPLHVWVPLVTRTLHQSAQRFVLLAPILEAPYLCVSLHATLGLLGSFPLINLALWEDKRVSDFFWRCSLAHNRRFSRVEVLVILQKLVLFIKF